MNLCIFLFSKADNNTNLFAFCHCLFSRWILADDISFWNSITVFCRKFIYVEFRRCKCLHSISPVFVTYIRNRSLFLTVVIFSTSRYINHHFRSNGNFIPTGNGFSVCNCQLCYIPRCNIAFFVLYRDILLRPSHIDQQIYNRIFFQSFDVRHICNLFSGTHDYRHDSLFLHNFSTWNILRQHKIFRYYGIIFLIRDLHDELRL